MILDPVAAYLQSLNEDNSNIDTMDKHLTLNESAIEFEPMQTAEIIKENKPTDLEKAKSIGIDTRLLEADIAENINKTEYEDALSVWKQLSDKEKLFATPRGKYVDSSYLIARSIAYKNNIPVGFADACDFKQFGSSKNAFISTIAILPKYRHQNIAEKLIKDLSRKLKGKYDNMLWKCDKENITSAKCAMKLGFSFYKQTKNSTTYIKQID